MRPGIRPQSNLVTESLSLYVAGMSMYSKDGSPGGARQGNDPQGNDLQGNGLQGNGPQDKGFQAYDAKVRRLHGARGDYEDFRGPRRRRGIRAVPVRVIVP